MCRLPSGLVLGFTFLLVCAASQPARSQLFGLELHNTVMPASGGMGGASIARPQDLTSAINANPAALTQFRGTQFLFSGAWVEPTYNLWHDESSGLPNVGSFYAKSEDQGLGEVNFGVTRELASVGLPATFGLAFVTSAGGGTGFRNVPESNGFDNLLLVFEVQAAVGWALTNRLSAGAQVSLGIGIFDGPFLGATTATYDYALRSSLGLNYDVSQHTNLGLYWQSRQSFVFDDAVRLDLGDRFEVSQDIDLDLPENVGIGISNNRLLGGDLLLAADVLFKQWDEADLFEAVYDNQWVLQLGAQLTCGRLRYRLGYAYAENPMDPDPGVSIGGVTPPGEVNAIQLAQGGVAIINEHRLSAGLGIRDLLRGMDLDLVAGGMPRASDQFGDYTAVNVETYWLAAGLTFRCGQGGSKRDD